MTASHPGRLETLLASLDAPAARPPSLPTPEVGYAVHDTPVGRILLACNDSGVLVGSLFAPDTGAEAAALGRLAARISPRILRRPRLVDPMRRWLDEYVSGRHTSLQPRWTLALATPFQATALTTLAARVGYGERATYGQLAQWAGRPRAARAVGRALANNPLCIVVPCHRIVGASDALTGYAGGLAAKRYLLDLESGSDPNAVSALPR